MDDSICKKMNALIALYADGKLDEKYMRLVENHLLSCPECRDKYVQMKNAVKNIRSSYEYLLREFEQLENNSVFKIKEYENFCSDISSYIDNEMSEKEEFNFRKFLVKSKQARIDLEKAYLLENTLKSGFKDYSDNLKINYADSIVKKIKSERKEKITMNFKRMIFALGVLLVFTIAFFVYVAATYNKQISDNTKIENSETVSTLQTPENTSDEMNLIEEEAETFSGESLAEADSDVQ